MGIVATETFWIMFIFFMSAAKADVLYPHQMCASDSDITIEVLTSIMRTGRSMLYSYGAFTAISTLRTCIKSVILFLNIFKSFD